MDYSKTFSTKNTPQTQKAPGTNQVKNKAGGYSFKVDDWKRLDRFLVLGADSGTYYTGKKEFIVENAECVVRCIAKDAERVVRRAVELSTTGRAPKNDAPLFVHALASVLGNDAARILAYKTLSDVARTGTHLFQWVELRNNLGGWGRGARSALKHWYLDKSVEKLVYQLIKYQQRNGWSHHDVLHLAHPKTNNDVRNDLFRYVKTNELTNTLQESVSTAQIVAAKELASVTDPKTAVKLITDFNLPREVVPTVLLNNITVWEALLEKMPVTATIRNLNKMTSIGLLKANSSATKKVVQRITDQEILNKGRVHPIAVLAALYTYKSGEGFRGDLTWDPVTQVVNALDVSFYKAFGSVEPTNKRLMLSLDVSGSMGWSNVNGLPMLTARDASAAMAMVTAAVESEYVVNGFTGQLVNLDISPRRRLDDNIRTVSGLSFGRTDCAQPMLKAIQEGLDVDAFVIYTDSETWCGRVHPFQALKQYRQKSGIPAKLIVVGLTANEFTIADPDDFGMLDVVGFDASAPNIISDFIRGEE
jgi:60 kDa SS-A/Ro ribonucleoprotein